MTNRGLKKFLNPTDIETGITEVVSMAKSEGISVALAGGVALQLIGSDRLTTDIDFLADAVPQGLTKEKPLSFGGSACKSPSEVPIDIIVRDDDYADLYQDALATAVMDKEIGARVVLPEYMMAMKLQAARAKDEQDIMKVIEENGVDLTKARAVIKKYLGKYAVDSFNSFVDEVAWEKNKQK